MAVIFLHCGENAESLQGYRLMAERKATAEFLYNKRLTTILRWTGLSTKEISWDTDIETVSSINMKRLFLAKQRKVN